MMITPLLRVTSGEQQMNNFDTTGDYKISWSIDEAGEKPIPMCEIQAKWTKNMGPRDNLALYVIDQEQNEVHKFNVDTHFGHSITLNCADIIDSRVSLVQISFLL